MQHSGLTVPTLLGVLAVNRPPELGNPPPRGHLPVLTNAVIAFQVNLLRKKRYAPEGRIIFVIDFALVRSNLALQQRKSLDFYNFRGEWNV